MNDAAQTNTGAYARALWVRTKTPKRVLQMHPAQPHRSAYTKRLWQKRRMREARSAARMIPYRKRWYRRPFRSTQRASSYTHPPQ